MGGSIAHADPAAEYPAVALALDASMEVVSSRGRRTIAARDFFDGLWSTSMETDELLAGVSYPIWGGTERVRRRGVRPPPRRLRPGRRGRRPSSSTATTGFVAAPSALIGMGSTPERALSTEAQLAGQPVTEIDSEEVGRSAVAGLEAVPSDLHGSADYRRRLGAAMVERAWKAGERGGAPWVKRRST